MTDLLSTDRRSVDAVTVVGTDSGVLIGRAKGVLVEAFGLTMAQAEQLLMTWARQCRTSQVKIAEALVRDVWEGRASGCETEVARYIENRLRRLRS